MIVVDANIIVYCVVETEHSPVARQVAQRDPQWVVASLWRFEFASALTKMVRGEALDTQQAGQALEEAETLTQNREIFVNQSDALRLALKFGVSAYDAHYLALAEALGTCCVTADARMVRDAPTLAVSPQEFISRP